MRLLPSPVRTALLLGSQLLILGCGHKPAVPLVDAQQLRREADELRNANQREFREAGAVRNVAPRERRER